MIRMRKDIDIDIKARKATLDNVIEESLRAEKECEDDIVFLNKRLSELTSETCFEDTREGITKALEDTAFGKIDRILEDLSKVTGKNYHPKFPSAISFGTFWHEALAKDLATREAGGIS